MSEIPPDRYRVSADGFFDMMGELQMDWKPHIHSDPEILLGKPVIKGTRLTVDFILRLLATGWTEQQILENYPTLTVEALRAIFAFAAECISNDYAQNEDEALWELHEIRHKFHKELKNKTIGQINSESLKKYQKA